MLEKLIVKNFQRHKFKEIIFDSNITVFVGSTDAGKSAIIRALRWVCLNRSPKNHIRWEAKFATVILHIDGHVIIRKQGKGVNYYSVDGKKLKSFNKGVPDKVAEILNIDAYNFQRQHDQSFWISLPPVQVTKELNNIVDLSVIDASLSNIAARVRKSKSELQISKERLSTAQKQKEELSWVDECKKRFETIEALQTSINRDETILSELSALTNDVATLDSLLGDAANRLQRVKILCDLARNVEELQTESSLLQKSISDIEMIEGEIWDLSNQLEIYEARISKVRRCPICGTIMLQKK